MKPRLYICFWFLFCTLIFSCFGELQIRCFFVYAIVLDFTRFLNWGWLVNFKEQFYFSHIRTQKCLAPKILILVITFKQNIITLSLHPPTTKFILRSLRFVFYLAYIWESILNRRWHMFLSKIMKIILDRSNTSHTDEALTYFKEQKKNWIDFSLILVRIKLGES